MALHGTAWHWQQELGFETHLARIGWQRERGDMHAPCGTGHTHMRGLVWRVSATPYEACLCPLLQRVKRAPLPLPPPPPAPRPQHVSDADISAITAMLQPIQVGARAMQGRGWEERAVDSGRESEGSMLPAHAHAPRWPCPLTRAITEEMCPRH